VAFIALALVVVTLTGPRLLWVVNNNRDVLSDRKPVDKDFAALLSLACGNLEGWT